MTHFGQNPRRGTVDRRRARRHVPKTAAHLTIHARRRALEYLGLDVTEDELQQLAIRIQKNEETFFGRESGNKTRWLVKLQGKECVAIYDKARHAVITVMTTEMFTETWVTGRAG